MIIEITCPFCQLSKRVPSEKIPDAVKWVTCPRCRQRFEFSKKEAERAASVLVAAQEISYQSAEEEKKKEPGKDTSRKGAPWEKRPEIGLWQAIFQTCKAVLFSPETLFKELTYEGGKTEPLAFGLLTGSIGSMLGLFWQSLIPGGLLLILGHSFLSQFAIGILVLFVLAMIPVMVAVGIFIYSGILHLLLLIVRGADNGFEATFRVVSYSQAAQLLGIIPFVGGWIGWVWQLIIQIIGFREMHETSYLRVILAFVIPLIVGIVLFLAVLIPLAIFIFHHPLGQIWS
jgi:transcription elongation factor Elf1